MPFIKLKIFASILLLFFGFQLSVAQDTGRKKFNVNGHEFLTTRSLKSAKIESILFPSLTYGTTGQLTSNGIIIELNYVF